MESKWFVYLLECSDGSLYCGITTDLEKRVRVHNSGKGAKYTKTRLPVKLWYFEESIDRSSASKREYEIKRLSRTEKLKLKKPSQMTGFLFCVRTFIQLLQQLRCQKPNPYLIVGGYHQLQHGLH